MQTPVTEMRFVGTVGNRGLVVVVENNSRKQKWSGLHQGVQGMTGVG